MIRFIDLDDQILEGTREFAWYDTITDTFEGYDCDETWSSWEEFEISYKTDLQTCKELYTHTPNPRPLELYKSLFPKDWMPS